MPRSNEACAPQQLSLRAAPTEARAPRAHAPQQEKPLQWEARALRQSGPRSAQLETVRAQQRRPNIA